MACNCLTNSLGILLERLTFDQLVAVSEPKRVLRSKTVRGPPLDLEAYADTVYYIFNFKSFPSTTGRRHKGFIKFFKPKRQIPLEKVECLVDCTCPDYRYRWAWVNKQKGSSVVGGKSMNQALNRAPKITNPKGRAGLCKHLLALRDYVYGQVEEFEGDRPDASKRLSRILKNVQTRELETGKGVVINDPKKPDPKKPDPKKPATPPTPPAKGSKITPTKPSASTVKPSKTGAPVAPVAPLPKKPTTQTKPVLKPAPKPAPKKADKHSGTDFLDRRFTKVESAVFSSVKHNFKEIQEEMDQVKVDGGEDAGGDGEASEALELLREIRDSLRILAASEEQMDAEPEPEVAAAGEEPGADLPPAEEGEEGVPRA